MAQSSRLDVEDKIIDAMLGCMYDKIGTGSYRTEYISPQELLEYLPQSLKINRDLHIFKHQSGQWEIRNRNIRCFVGFQVHTDPETKSVIRHALRK
eukprot:375840_1